MLKAEQAKQARHY